MNLGRSPCRNRSEEGDRRIGFRGGVHDSSCYGGKPMPESYNLRLSVRRQGLDFRLTGVEEANVVKDILA